jgi:hypothetical protein
MREKLTDEDREHIENTAKWVAAGLSAGKNKKSLIKVLVEQNWPEHTARSFVDRTELVVANTKPMRKERPSLTE